MISSRYEPASLPTTTDATHQIPLRLTYCTLKLKPSQYLRDQRLIFKQNYETVRKIFKCTSLSFQCVVISLFAVMQLYSDWNKPNHRSLFFFQSFLIVQSFALCLSCLFNSKATINPSILHLISRYFSRDRLALLA